MNFDGFHLFSRAGRCPHRPALPAGTARERLQQRNAASQAGMSRHFNNPEDLTETTASYNPEFDYKRMKSGAIDNRREYAAFD
ncbi:hypothetical protein [Burkholderia lata]|uniref:hypothetical protein n=1 Tax=Burkholderia lata (strain ATCC 17760 / DSM 23089 / LMG 22485 / NCIMB 9086 / R18194 / 383) TaxID=482957 RepID=UPI001583A50E|nr:hypothetical protein [Burkholderia lata]